MMNSSAMVAPVSSQALKLARPDSRQVARPESIPVGRIVADPDIGSMIVRDGLDPPDRSDCLGRVMIAGKRRLRGKCLARVERIPGEEINPVRQAQEHAQMTRCMAWGAQRDHGAVAEEITVRYELDYG